MENAPGNQFTQLIYLIILVSFTQVSNRNLKIFRVPLKRQAHKSTNLFIYLSKCLLHKYLSNCNLGISRASLKSQPHQGTSLFTSAATNQRGCPKGNPW